MSGSNRRSYVLKQTGRLKLQFKLLLPDLKGLIIFQYCCKQVMQNIAKHWYKNNICIKRRSIIGKILSKLIYASE